MSRTQTIIKYLALALALFIISSIVSCIILGFKTFSYIFSDEKNGGELKDITIDCNFDNINMEINSIDLEVKTSIDFKIETNGNIEVLCRKNVLSINDLSKVANKDNKMIIYLPEDKILNSSTIELGAGKVSLNNLNTSNLMLELGAGKVVINDLNVSNKVEIEGGMGEFIVNSSIIKNLDLDIGMGKTTINSKLLGDNEINAGIGQLNLNLVSQDYKININKGIGSATIDGEKISNDKDYGTGDNVINIEGGIGNIKIKTNQ